MRAKSSLRRARRAFALVVGLSLAAPWSLAPGGVPEASAQPRPAPRGAKVKKGKVDVAAQRAALLAGDVERAAAAAAELGKTDDPAAHAALLEGLGTGLHPEVAVAALAALGAAPRPGDLTTLTRYLRARPPAVRAAAVRALGAHADAGALILTALRDQAEPVRAAAAEAVVARRPRGAAEPLVALLDKGELPAARALAAIADAELARVVAERIGTAPDGVLAQCLGQILVRPDFGPDPARVQVVLALAKLAGPEAITALGDYIDATPATPPRASRREAENVLKQKLGDD
ncbi:MAG: HEAT repeat domain-containing protein [Myxococcales bacterium]|nr:HEAT repeat domain-containing protein [Myxococcales bacterium]